MRSSVLACYGNFYHGVRNSDALELRMIAWLAADDIRSTAGINLRNLARETGCDPVENRHKLRETILASRCPVPATDTWRVPCLKKFLEERHRMEVHGDDTSEVEALILSLVTS